MPKKCLAKIYQETAGKRNRGTILGKTEFIAITIKTDYILYLTIIKGTIHSEEL